MNLYSLSLNKVALPKISTGLQVRDCSSRGAGAARVRSLLGRGRKAVTLATGVPNQHESSYQGAKANTKGRVVCRARTQQHVNAALATEVMAPNVGVTFEVQQMVNFGQHIAIVGDCEALGNWDVGNALPMEWHEGHVWKAAVDLPGGRQVEYKYVMRSGWTAGAVDPVTWQPGENCAVGTNYHARVAVVDRWDMYNTGPGPEAHHHEAPSPAAVADNGEVPDWAYDAIGYEIYPYGFFDTPDYNDHSGPVVPRMAKIRDYYTYFQRVGVNMVYLAPIFENDTHGYDTTDHYMIDRRLGDMALFKEIVAELKDLGIRVILDGVFNHTGRTHAAFTDVTNVGPAKSSFATWYHIGARPSDHPGWCEVSYSETESGFAFDCWEGHHHLPRLDLANPEVRRHIFDIAKYYLTEVGVAGWRLDVAHEMPPEFWAEFRRECKAAAPDCLLIGEMIHSNYTTWVGPKLLDSGTNYQLSKATWSAMNDLNMFELAHQMQREDSLYSSLFLLNFVSNHDTARVASRLSNPAHNALVLTFMMCQRGIPCLYYGDELGMLGDPEEAQFQGPWGGDWTVRQPMPPPGHPPHQDSIPGYAESLVDLTSRLGDLRRQTPALSRGSQRSSHIANNNNALAFLRVSSGQAAIIAMNASSTETETVVVQTGLEGGLLPGVSFQDRLCFSVPAPAEGAGTPEVAVVHEEGDDLVTKLRRKLAANPAVKVDEIAYLPAAEMTSAAIQEDGSVRVLLPPLSARVLTASW